MRSVQCESEVVNGKHPKLFNTNINEQLTSIYYLLNQSPELYESRSRDLERNMSSPAWKKGIPCTDTHLYIINRNTYTWPVAILSSYKTRIVLNQMEIEFGIEDAPGQEQQYWLPNDWCDTFLQEEPWLHSARHSLKSGPKVAVLNLKIVLGWSHQMRRGAIIVGVSWDHYKIFT